MSSQALGPVLIVGGCGLLGRHIALAWSSAHPDLAIHALDKTIPSGGKLPAFAELHECDITDANQVDSVMQRVRPVVVVHTASPRPFLHSFDFCLKINRDGTAHLLDSAARAGVKAFVYTSSSSVVHDSVSDLVNVDESLPRLFIPQQGEPYHHSKAVAEDLVLRANGSNGMLTAALRPCGLFGPNDQDDQTTARILKSAIAGKLRIQLGDNSNLTDWTWIENAARAHVQASKALVVESGPEASIKPDLKVAGEAFFISNDEPVPFWNFARGLGSAAGYGVDAKSIRVIPQWLAYPIGFVAEWVVWAMSFGTSKATFNRRVLKYSCLTRTFNISKAKTRLGYDPKAWVDMQEAFQLATAPHRKTRSAN